MKHLFYIMTFLLLGFTAYTQNDFFDISAEYNLLYVDKNEVKDDSTQRLNLFIPKVEKEFPLLIWIGGGAWSYVNRHVETDMAKQFAKRGIAFAAVGHRLSSATWRDTSMNDGNQHPKHIEDIASAVKWLYENAENYGYDNNQIFIGGFSSGAHLSALLVLDTTYLQNVGLSKDIIRGVIPISGVYDIVNYYEVFLNGRNPSLAETHVQAVFGEEKANMINASPITYIENLSTPMLVMTDGGGALPDYTRIFDEQIRASTDFTDIEFLYINHISHGDLWRHISRRDGSIYRNMIIDFIERWFETE